MASTLPLPQFVVIHDQTTETYKHPIVHYIFEDEEPSLDLSKSSQCIVVELSGSNASQIATAASYSSAFQVSDCRIESAANISTSGGQTDNSGLLMLKIEGLSSTRVEDDSRQGVPTTLEELDTLISKFRQRNEAVRKILSKDEIAINSNSDPTGPSPSRT